MLFPSHCLLKLLLPVWCSWWVKNWQDRSLCCLHTHQLGIVQVETIHSYFTGADALHIWPDDAISSKAKWPVRFHVHSIFYPHVDFQLCQTVYDSSNVPTCQQWIFRLSRIWTRGSKPVQSGFESVFKSTKTQYFQ